MVKLVVVLAWQMSLCLLGELLWSQEESKGLEEPTEMRKGQQSHNSGLKAYLLFLFLSIQVPVLDH